MKKLTLLPFVLLFVSPWIHRLAFENLRLAIPDISKDDAHGWIIGITVVCLLAVLPFIAAYIGKEANK